MSYFKFKAIGRTMSVRYYGNHNVTEKLRLAIVKHLREHPKDDRDLSFSEMMDITNGTLIKMNTLERDYFTQFNRTPSIIVQENGVNIGKITGEWK